MEDFHKLWLDFKSEFVNQIKLQSDKGLIETWLNRTSRTTFYKKIYPYIAEKLDLKYFPKEFLKVDATMYRKDKITNWEIPVIFIESENDFETAEEEVYKLCSLSAPIRVLITISDEINNEKLIGWVKNWSSYIETCSEVWPNKGILGIIITDNKFNFYSMAWNEKGSIFESLKEPIYRNDSK